MANLASHSVAIRDVAARSMAAGKRLIGQGWWAPPPLGVDPETSQGNPFMVYAYSTQMAEVIVDVQTGEVEVTDFVAAFDVGKAINPQGVEGQIGGGVAMGLGYALMEEVVLVVAAHMDTEIQDEKGRMDIGKAKLFTFCAGATEYWSLGESIGSYGFTKGKLD